MKFGTIPGESSSQRTIDLPKQDKGGKGPARKHDDVVQLFPLSSLYHPYICGMHRDTREILVWTLLLFQCDMKLQSGDASLCFLFHRTSHWRRYYTQSEYEN
jgi:hypothetical protein